MCQNLDLIKKFRICVFKNLFKKKLLTCKNFKIKLDYERSNFIVFALNFLIFIFFLVNSLIPYS